MVPIKFASLVLGLLFVLHALTDSSAQAHQSGEFNGNERNGPMAATGENIAAAVRKEFVEQITGADHSTKKGLGGRKMVVDKVKTKGNEKGQEEEELHGKNSKISGKDMNASKKSLGGSQDHLIDQNSIKKLVPKTLMESANKSISWSETVHYMNTNDPHSEYCSQNSKAFSSKCSSSSESSKSNKQASQDHQHNDDIAQKDESQDQEILLEADKQIVSLLHKDYRGMDKPRRKPPINNHKPTD